MRSSLAARQQQQKWFDNELSQTNPNHMLGSDIFEFHRNSDSTVNYFYHGPQKSDPNIP